MRCASLRLCRAMAHGRSQARELLDVFSIQDTIVECLGIEADVVTDSGIRDAPRTANLPVVRQATERWGQDC